MFTKLSKNVLYVFVIVLVVAFIFSMYSKSLPEQKDISLNQFMYMVKEGSFEEITIKDDVLIATADDIQYEAKSDLQSSFYELLDYYQIGVEDVAGVDIEYQKDVD